LVGYWPFDGRRSRQRETISVACSLLTVEHFFSRGASVNIDLCNLQIDEQIPVVAAQNQSLAYAGPRIERCEFETLLERAMEILSAPAKSASSPHA
jgi:hypothetical protein